MTRAKVRCQSATPKTEGQDQKVSLFAVCGPENAQWSGATPILNLNMEIRNPEAQIFQAGKDYYLDISEVPAPVADAPSTTAG